MTDEQTGLRVADAFADAQVTDADFLIQCTCGLEQRLDTMLVDELRELTLYDCSRCENTIVAILTDAAAAQLRLASSMMVRRSNASGHRLNGYVIGCRVDLALRPAGADEDVALIYSQPDFFDALRNV